MTGVSLSVAVIAHPRRAALVERLIAQLGLTPDRVVWDRRDDQWDTARRAMLLFDPAATHHLLLEDDAAPCPDLLAGCAAVLEHVPPGHPVALYMGAGRTKPRAYSMRPLIDTARSAGASFAVFEGPWWGPGVILPASSIGDAVAWGDAHPRLPYDHRLANFYARRGVLCYYTLPSLVDHLNGPGNPSLLGHGHGRGRRAAWPLRDSALSVPWCSRVVTVDDLPARLRAAFPPTPGMG